VTRTAYLDHPGPVPLSHRGYSTDGLENSMAAFEAAVRLGYRYLETDVHATSDGVLLAFHDASLDRVTDAAGEVARLPWSTVSRARIGGTEPIPQLAEILGTWPHVRVNVDLKSAAAILPLVEVIERTAAHDRVCVASFSDRRRLAALRRLSRPVATSAGQGVAARFVAALRLPAGRRDVAVRRILSGVDLLQVPERVGRLAVVTAGSLQVAHAAGVGVHVWTVNEETDMGRLLDLGVDGLVTDRADVLRRVLLERGTWHAV
jgi:glycerophosphoryl diester phosphodiesterase